jgi:hypothetical protein
MGSNSQDTGEVLAGQGEMADRVDSNHCGLLSSRFKVPQSFSLAIVASRSVRVSASAWWWYWAPTEEASALA